MGSAFDRPCSLLDAHVHLHRCFSEEAFLEAALSNFRQARRRLRLADASPGVLALTDICGEDAFERLHQWAARSQGAWRVRPTAERASFVIAGDADGDELILIAGRQIATRQGVEVLALGTGEKLEDGQSLAETLESVSSAGALAVLPWGFGKWWLGRGRLLEGLLQESDARNLFLGDNGGRPRLGPTPRAFRLAKQRGIRVLPGSDPLPFPAHAGRAGSFGAVVEGGLDSERPAAALKKLLAENPGQPRAYGSLRLLRAFLRDQVAMQLRKRRFSTPG